MISPSRPDETTGKDFDTQKKLVDDNCYGADRNEIAESYVSDCPSQTNCDRLLYCDVTTIVYVL